jgi:hypothetical protein
MLSRIKVQRSLDLSPSGVKSLVDDVELSPALLVFDGVNCDFFFPSLLPRGFGILRIDLLLRHAEYCQPPSIYTTHSKNHYVSNNIAEYLQWRCSGFRCIYLSLVEETSCSVEDEFSQVSGAER